MYPTSSLAFVLREIDDTARNLRSYALERYIRCTTSTQTSTVILDTFTILRQIRQRLNTLAGHPGLAQYARDQKNDQELDVVTEFTAMLAAIDAATGWIATNFPASGGYLQAKTLGADGPVDRTFTVASLSGLATVLQNIVNTISE